MRIRPATDDDLPSIGRIFDRSAAWLTENYRPDQVVAQLISSGGVLG